ncbi:L,D-transpeptidase family protein [Rhodococcus tukisamuensis]|uniref:L,D-peptidoglycan transpeptidase YkuD, ErfK/YbiS/YcfS/YnhG family n=1 Tax=Rhodococcus tukisamuensis TaxID=168276 RepID=A0A1G7AS53_9NOCA|nr:L,D-transpeptidase family protein [Rhodococcus tukisamuensis]SDE17633.1 L,D-peptidoglycan transpeptidase YkuD, ErfK/YbiS/YcfS/YnhG family [Rhodococcus tukisamuensis]
MRRAGSAVLSVVVATLLALLCAPHAVAQGPWFDHAVGSANQVIAVRGSGAGTTVEAWQRSPLGWHRISPAIPAEVGAAGFAAEAADGVPATPEGVFTLDAAFGTQPSPGGGLPYRVVGPDDWWDGDRQSPTYNTHQVCPPGSCGFDESQSEQLAIPAYRYAVVMGVNAERRPGGGGAFFLHVANGQPTEGCVAVDEAPLVWLIRWLRPGAVIAITG